LSSAHNSTIHNSVTITIDYIRLRKYSSSGDPATTFGNQGTNNLSASITSQSNVLCFGQSTGSATVTATGGTSPYTYLWSNSQTTQSATGLSATTYTVTITDNIGLSTTATATITQPATAVSASISSQTNVLCNGQSNGSVTVAGSGGSGAYTYALGVGTYVSSGTFGSLAATTYTIHVKDGNGCIFDQTVTITQPDAVTASVIGQTNISCFGGSDGTITILAGGGNGHYSYSVDNGSPTSWVSSDINPYPFTGLSANVQYKIRVKDSNGCESPAIP
jgi:hypothetical protein